MKWLLSETKVSRDDSVNWILATASAHGDLNTVRLLAAQAGTSATDAVSQALRSAVLYRQSQCG
jgi:hypothetical protein